MTSQGIFPDADWTRQTPRHSPQNDNNNEYEHGVRPLRTHDLGPSTTENFDLGSSGTVASDLKTKAAMRAELQHAEIARAKREQEARQRQAEERRTQLTAKFGDHLARFAEALQDESKSATFTCGGEIPIVLDAAKNGNGDLTPQTGAKVQAQEIMTKPVTIRWGRHMSGRTVTLPVWNDVDALALQALIGHCTPATFGRGGTDIYDESYRKAGAMPITEFMTDFCPYESGILDAVAQLLVPSIAKRSGLSGEGQWQRGLRAELYKLNVYSAPSGLFRAHVDTPRSEAQVGSLVVCLPVPFQGGALAVRHQGCEVLHDWSHTRHYASSQVQWAAFYSDCEHEVLQVTAGHRVTLTYNLFLSAGTGLLGGRATNMNPKSLPLFKTLDSMLREGSFMPAGGYLGVHLTHSYPHTDPKLYQLVPAMLKGVDLAIFQSLHSAKLRSALVPISSEAELPPSDVLWKLNARAPSASPFWNGLESFSTRDFDDGESLSPNESEIDTDSDSCLEDNESDFARYSERGQEIAESKRANRQIVWINSNPCNRELSEAYMAYGNQAELKVKYTSAALVVKIPTFEQRSGKAAQKEGDQEMFMEEQEEGGAEMSF